MLKGFHSRVAIIDTVKSQSHNSQSHKIEVLVVVILTSVIKQHYIDSLPDVKVVCVWCVVLCCAQSKVILFETAIGMYNLFQKRVNRCAIYNTIVERKYGM